MRCSSITAISGAAKITRIVGIRRARIALLLRHDLNLYAFHLPLDAHPEVGNNVALARRLGFAIAGRFGEQDLGLHGDPGDDVDARRARGARRRAARAPAARDRRRLAAVRRIAWCTGAAQGYLEDAVRSASTRT